MGPGADQGDRGNDEGKPRHRVGENGMDERPEAGDTDQSRDGAENAKRGENNEREWIVAHLVALDEGGAATGAGSGRRWQTRATGGRCRGRWR